MKRCEMDNTTRNVIPHPASKGEGVLDDGGYCLIPPGTYDLGYIRHATFRLGKVVKLAVWFRVLTMGPAFEATVPRFYNVKRVHKGGNCTFARHSNFVFEFLTLFPQPVTHYDRFPIRSSFRNVILSGEVRTVTHNREQRHYNEHLQYSVVDRLTGVKR
jgi:hypothetical protein